MDKTYFIEIPKYTKWNKDVANRSYFAVKTEFASDKKFERLPRAERANYVTLFLHLIGQASYPGELTIKTEKELRRIVSEGIFKANHIKLHPESWLWHLKDVGLINITVDGVEMSAPESQDTSKFTPKAYRKEERPELTLKTKTVKENAPKKAPRFSEEAKQLAFYGIKKIKDINKIAINQADTYKQFAKAESLLADYDATRLRQAIDWMFTQERMRAKITSFVQIGWFVPEYIANHRDHAANDFPYRKDREGRYCSDGEHEPGNDDTVPFNQLNHDSQAIWLNRHGLLVNYTYPVMECLDDPSLRAYVIEGYTKHGITKLEEAYRRITDEA